MNGFSGGEHTYNKTNVKTYSILDNRATGVCESFDSVAITYIWTW